MGKDSHLLGVSEHAQTIWIYRGEPGNSYGPWYHGSGFSAPNVIISFCGYRFRLSNGGDEYWPYMPVPDIIKSMRKSGYLLGQGGDTLGYQGERYREHVNRLSNRRRWNEYRISTNLVHVCLQSIRLPTIPRKLERNTGVCKWRIPTS